MGRGRRALPWDHRATPSRSSGDRSGVERHGSRSLRVHVAGAVHVRERAGTDAVLLIHDTWNALVPVTRRISAVILPVSPSTSRSRINDHHPVRRERHERRSRRAPARSRPPMRNVRVGLVATGVHDADVPAELSAAPPFVITTSRLLRRARTRRAASRSQPFEPVVDVQREIVRAGAAPAGMLAPQLGREPTRGRERGKVFRAYE